MVVMRNDHESLNYALYWPVTRVPAKEFDEVLEAATARLAPRIVHLPNLLSVIVVVRRGAFMYLDRQRTNWAAWLSVLDQLMPFLTILGNDSKSLRYVLI